MKGNPTTPQHSDSHPCTSPPLGGHEWSRNSEGYGTTNVGYGTTNADARVGIGLKRGISLKAGKGN